MARNSPLIMEPGGPPLSSHRPATNPYPEPHEFSPVLYPLSLRYDF